MSRDGHTIVIADDAGWFESTGVDPIVWLHGEHDISTEPALSALLDPRVLELCDLDHVIVEAGETRDSEPLSGELASVVGGSTRCTTLEATSCGAPR